MSEEELSIWRLTDGKAGHEAQTIGLVDALRRLRPVRAVELPAMPRFRGWANWVTGRFPAGANLPDPDLIIGAGHATHPSLLAARRARGGRSVVLMKPSVPLGWFDLCLIPEHDEPPALDNVISTEGVLNPVTPSGRASGEKGLVLIGGPSKHHDWDEARICEQVAHLAEKGRDIEWVLTTSRRTPKETTGSLVSMGRANLEVVPFEDTRRGWVAGRLAECGVAWVSEDSVSMVYEALTAGAAVGLLSVPRKPGRSRVVASVETLLDNGRVERLDLSSDRYRPERAAEALAEADRCARLVLERIGRS